MSAQTEYRQRTIFERVADHLRTPLFRNGYALTLSSLSTSGIGVLYWIIAAHKYSAYAIGLNSAALSAMMFLAGVAELNLMSALIRFIPVARGSTTRLVALSYLVSLAVGALTSFVFLKWISFWSPTLEFLAADKNMSLWFIISTMLWCIFVLQDSVLTGLKKATWVPVENVVFSLTKIALMIAFAITIPAIGIFASWSFALIVAVLPTNYFIFRLLIPVHERESGEVTDKIDSRQVVRFAAPDYLGALSWLIVTNLLPVVVANVASATANAYFYLAWTIANTLYLISSSMGSSLVVETAKEQVKLAHYSLRIFWDVALLVGFASLILVAGAPFILEVFGRDYSLQGTLLLRLLTLSAIPFVINSLFVSIARAQKRMRAVVYTLGSLCILVMSSSYVLLRTLGIVGVGVSWLASQSIIAGVIYFTQLREFWSNDVAAGVEEVAYFRNQRPPEFSIYAFNLVVKLHLMRILKFPTRAWVRYRRRNQVVAVLPEIAKEFPPAIFDHSEGHWMVRRIVHTETNKTVAFIETKGGPSLIVIKLPDSAKDTESQRRQRDTLQFLQNDNRLGQWRKLLPTIVAEGSSNGQSFFAEQAIEGKPLRRFYRNPKEYERVVDIAAREISYLHQKTANCVVVNSQILRNWIYRPVDEVLHFDARITSNNYYQDAIDHLVLNLEASLAGKEVCSSWIHGDYAPSNILLNASGSKVIGIVDWDQAHPDDLPLLDLMHLFISVRMDMTQQEMGHVVSNLLKTSGWTNTELNLLRNAQASLPGDSIDAQALLLLGWLHHITANIKKTSRFDHNYRWISENILAVLKVL